MNAWEGFVFEGDIEESQVSMVIDEDVDSDSQYEMENEKDLSDSEIESDLEEDIGLANFLTFLETEYLLC